MHGPTFMANALACAVGVASVELLLEQDWRSQCRDRGRPARRVGARPALPGVVDVRVLGAIGVIEMDKPVDLRVATAAALEHGVWLRPFRNLIYAMPPYICTPDEMPDHLGDGRGGGSLRVEAGLRASRWSQTASARIEDNTWWARSLRSPRQASADGAVAQVRHPLLDRGRPDVAESDVAPTRGYRTRHSVSVAL